MQSNGENTAPLVNRIFRAATWTLIGYGGSQVIRLLSNLVMTRLLAPEMFGIMALGQVFLFIMTLISDVGLRANIIRSDRGDDPVFVNTAWTIQVIRGAVISLGVVFCAVGISYGASNGFFKSNSAYAAEALPVVIVLISLSSFISGFNSTNIVMANRKLWLGKITALGIFSQIVGVAAMISWAMIDRSIWALVAGALITASCHMVLSHLYLPGIRNKFTWEWGAFWEIFHFGKWVLASSIITAFYSQGDRLFLGAFETTTIIGIYSIAYFLFFSVVNVLSAIVSKVYFPVLCEVHRDKKDDLLSYYYKIRKTTDAISMFLAGALYVSGSAIVEFLYDDRYASAGGMLSILALGLLFLIPNSTSALMLAIGNSKYEAGLRFIQFSSLVVFMPILYGENGINGVLYAIVLVLIVSTCIDIIYRSKKGLIIWSKEFRMLPCVILGYLVGLAFIPLLAALPEF